MIKLFNYLLIANAFLGSFILFSSPFDFYVGYVFIISFLIFYVFHYTISINLNFLLLLTALTIVSLGNVYFENDTLFLMAKQVFGILITGSAYYLLIKINKYEIHKLFRIYLRIALIVAAIGIFQELSYLAGFERGYNYKYIITHWNFSVTGFGILKVNSILPEPAVFAMTMAPAFFVSMFSIFRKNSLWLNKKSSILLIMSSYILTFSAVAYVAILASLILLYFGSIKKIMYPLLCSIIFIFVFISYSYVPDISERIDDTLGVATRSSRIENINVSAYAFTSNAFVAYKCFIDSPLFGYGLGSHPISYDKYISGGSGDFYRRDILGINKEDANSLLFRLASETGLSGILVVLYFIFKFYLKNRDGNDLQIISNAMFIMLMTALLRQGHYFANGFFFFVWMYYFAYMIHNKKLCRGYTKFRSLKGLTPAKR